MSQTSPVDGESYDESMYTIFVQQSANKTHQRQTTHRRCGGDLNGAQPCIK